MAAVNADQAVISADNDLAGGAADGLFFVRKSINFRSQAERWLPTGGYWPGAFQVAERPTLATFSVRTLKTHLKCCDQIIDLGAGVARKNRDS